MTDMEQVDNLIETSTPHEPRQSPIKSESSPDEPAHSLQVHIASQRLKLLYCDGRMRHYPVSTSKKGINNRSGSLGTPTGWHRVCARIGEGEPSGMVFAIRKPTGRVVTPITESQATSEDLITSRILWLEGLEEGVNKGGEVDSKSRFIYIHGTHEEGLIGTPASHGCIRMTNRDVIELFDQVEIGARVLILAT